MSLITKILGGTAAYTGVIPYRPVDDGKIIELPTSGTYSPDPSLPNQGTGTGTGTQNTPNADTIERIERMAAIERVRTHPDLDPSAKSRILALATNRPSLTAYEIRLLLTVCLYPDSQGLPAPEGYEYFLTLVEKGENVAGALSDTRIKFNAAKNQKGQEGDPNAPDSQEEAKKQARIIFISLAIFIFLILRQS